jgi:hypothetical protein
MILKRLPPCTPACTPAPGVWQKSHAALNASTTAIDLLLAGPALLYKTGRLEPASTYYFAGILKH